MSKQNNILSGITKVVSLSHNDADGYGCQFMINRAIDRRELEVDIKWINTGYGPGMKVALEELATLAYDSLVPPEETMVVITDLNLSLEEIDKLLAMEGYGFKVVYIDHHRLSKDVQVEDYDFFYHDLEKSATLATYELFLGEGDEEPLIKILAEAINAADIFDKSDINAFHNGRVISDLITRESGNFPRMFQPLHTRSMLEIMRRLVLTIHIIKYNGKEVTPINIEKEYYILLSMESTIPSYLDVALQTADYIEKNKLFHKQVGNKNVSLVQGKYPISDVADVLFERGICDVIISPTTTGGCGIRTKGDKIDSAVIARLFDPKGGGHFNAAGCKFTVEKSNMFSPYVQMPEEIWQKVETYIKEC